MTRQSGRPSACLAASHTHTHTQSSFSPWHISAGRQRRGPAPPPTTAHLTCFSFPLRQRRRCAMGSKFSHRCRVSSGLERIVFLSVVRFSPVALQRPALAIDKRAFILGGPHGSKGHDRPRRRTLQRCKCWRTVDAEWLLRRKHPVLASSSDAQTRWCCVEATRAASLRVRD